ncbi:hypothetical protein Tco_0250333, partial [Tanacetum coccineum]
GPTSDRARGGMTLEELYILCTNLSKRVLALEASKDAQAAEILKLKTRINKLKKKKSHLVISHHRTWLRSVSRLSMKRKLGRKESVSKQGRKIAKPEPEPTLDAFDDLDADGGSIEGTVSTAVPKIVSTTRLELSTARPDVDAARFFNILIKIILNPEAYFPQIDPKDKGKGVLEDPEPAKKMTKSDFDAASFEAATGEIEEYTIRKNLGSYKSLSAERQRHLKDIPRYVMERQRSMFKILFLFGSAKEERMIKKMELKRITGDETSTKERFLIEPLTVLNCEKLSTKDMKIVPEKKTRQEVRTKMKLTTDV